MVRRVQRDAAWLLALIALAATKGAACRGGCSHSASRHTATMPASATRRRAMRSNDSTVTCAPELLDTTAERGIDRLLEQYAADVRTVARSERVALVDIYRAFEAYGRDPGKSVNDLLLAGDGIHPNQAGQTLVCWLLADELVKHVL